MDAKMVNMEILGELSEFITLRMSSISDQVQSCDWTEHKAHPDYDLWFVQSGIVKITINGFEHTAHPGDIVFFYPGVPYTASTASAGCRFIYIHFDIGIGKQQRILNDFQLSGIIPKALIQEEFELFGTSFMQSKNNLYLKACLTAVIAKIIELYSQDLYIGTFLNGKASRKSTRSLDVLQPVFKHVDEHLNQSITINELAALVGLSEKYFISYFKKPWASPQGNTSIRLE